MFFIPKWKWISAKQWPCVVKTVYFSSIASLIDDHLPNSSLVTPLPFYKYIDKSTHQIRPSEKPRVTDFSCLSICHLKGKLFVLSPHSGSELCSIDCDKNSLVIWPEQSICIYNIFVVVNFDALAQASDIRTERRQVVLLWMHNSNPWSQSFGLNNPCIYVLYIIYIYMYIYIYMDVLLSSRWSAGSPTYSVIYKASCIFLTRTAFWKNSQFIHS